MRLRGLSAATLLAAISTAADPAPFPAGPEDHECAEGTEKHVEETRWGLDVRCLRADGVPVGPQISWYPDGKPREIKGYLAHETGSNIHGAYIQWQPDGSKYQESRWDDGAPVGEHITWLGSDRAVTYLYEAGVLIDIYAGPERPPFTCRGQRVPRVRTWARSGSGVLGHHPSPRPAIELWCENPHEPARFPAYEESARPMRVECRVTSEGILIGIGPRWGSAYADRLPAPKGLDPGDPDAVRALCRRSDFWRRHRREGPYVSRDANGETLEEGPYVRGRRHGIFRVHGLACVRWRNGTRLARAPCPAGPPYTPDPWIATAWVALDRARVQLGWPALEEGSPDEAELRIWGFPKPPSGPVLPGTGAAKPVLGRLPRVLRLRGASAAAHGELATWKAPPELLHSCDRRDAEAVCRFTDPTPWDWETLVHELHLLDAWSLPAASTIRVPAISRDPGEKRFGIFVEARVDGRVSRDWYGPVRGEVLEATHRIRGITRLMDSAWAEVVRAAQERAPEPESARD